MEHLDRYEGDGIDDAYVDDITEEERFAARLAAERELAERDLVEGRLTGRRRGLPAALEGARQPVWRLGAGLEMPCRCTSDAFCPYATHALGSASAGRPLRRCAPVR